MLRQILQARSHTHEQVEGELIDRVRMYEMVSNIGFLGRRGRVYRRIVGLSGARPGDRVLDVGCNGGYLARLFAAAVAPRGRVTGIDPSESAIEYARRRSPAGCEFVVGVAQDLGLPDGSVDIVASTLAIHHIPAAEQATAFTEMYRVLRPGGTLLVADFRPSGRGPHAFGSGMRHIDPDYLDGLTTDAGFRIEDRGDLPMLRYIRAVTLPRAG